MKKKLVLGMIAAVTISQAATPAFAVDKETIGGIIGGIIGGVSGTQIGKGNGNKAAIIIGAIAGTMIGSSIGSNMDEADQRQMAEAQRRSLGGRVGYEERWQGRRGGSGSFTTTREGYNSYTGEYCREYRSVINYNGRREEQRGIACSRRDGSWYEVRESQVSFGGRGPGRPVEPVQPVRPVPPVAPVAPGRPGQYDPPGRGQYEGRETIYRITRRSGGEWYRLTVDNAMRLSRLEVAVLSAGVKIHEAYVHTDRGEKIRVRELIGASARRGDVIFSENLNLRDRVRAIDIRVESMGGEADIELTAVSTDGRPRLSAQRY